MISLKGYEELIGDGRGAEEGPGLRRHIGQQQRNFSSTEPSRLIMTQCP
jgi:hypothetical protein